MTVQGMGFGLLKFHFSPGVLETISERPMLSGLVAGVAEIGTELTALSNGSIATGTIVWMADGQPIAGATQARFTPTSAQEAQDVTVSVDSSVPSLAAPVFYPVPQTVGTLPAQALTQGTGTVSVNASGAFSFAGTAHYQLFGAPSGVSVDGAGTLSFDTDTLAPQSATTITLRTSDAGNGARFAETSFTLSVTASVSVPEAFGSSAWSLADLGTGGDGVVTIIALPGDGGSPITNVERRIDAGAWIGLGGINPGSYILEDAFTDGVESAVELRAVNSVGPGPASADKFITTTTAAWTAPTITAVSSGLVTLASGSNAPQGPATPTITATGDGSVTLTAAA